MSKDQAIGEIILIVCVMVAIFYIVTLFYPQWLSMVGIQAAETDIQFWIFRFLSHTFRFAFLLNCIAKILP